MALQNIGFSNKDDAFYRYKMPRMRTKIESHGNGIGTRIENMADIAKALARPAQYITKYFKHELGAQSNFDDKTGTSLVKGAHDTAKLAGLLDNFIKKYVQCYGCHNPETEILISRTQMKLRRAEKERLKEGVAADGKQKKLKKDAKKKDRTSNESTEDHSISPTHNQHVAIGVDANESDSDDVQWQTDTSLEAAKQRMQEQLSAATAGMVMLSMDEPEKKKLHASDDKQTNKTIVYTNPCGELVEQIRTNMENAARANHVRGVLSSTLSQDVMNSLFEALFDCVRKGLKDELMKNMEYLTVAVPDEVSQALLLQAIEAFGAKCSAVTLKEIPFVLEALYREDVLEEETIVQ
ncbi:hypothetical protein PR202_gb29822 [Eleusine coracana subsp. coracana]|uniref:W2 domain-containing protein n=1 Tax=Eleusine coracana subsp. coracana TaxID=191504 RepID=A0AAV5FZV4_ELECO|nr:hypothetical protein PR202_gb29822 [Eleusine coracana subsp. coracana]